MENKKEMIEALELFVKFLQGLSKAEKYPSEMKNGMATFMYLGFMSGLEKRFGKEKMDSLSKRFGEDSKCLVVENIPRYIVEEFYPE